MFDGDSPRPRVVPVHVPASEGVVVDLIWQYSNGFALRERYLPPTYREALHRAAQQKVGAMKKFDLKQFGRAVQMLGPAILTLAGVSPVMIGLATHAIVVAEGIKGATGAEKKAAALELIRTGATAADALVHPDVQDVDVEQITATVSQGIDAVLTTVKTVENIPVKHVG